MNCALLVDSLLLLLLLTRLGTHPLLGDDRQEQAQHKRDAHPRQQREERPPDPVLERGRDHVLQLLGQAKDAAGTRLDRAQRSCDLEHLVACNVSGVVLVGDVRPHARVHDG